MKKLSKILWGIVLIAVGVLVVLNALNITHLEIFFDGWWTLFIIIPCTIGLFSERDKTGNLIGLSIGVLLLLWRQDVLSLDLMWKLVIPVIIIFIGLKLLIGSLFGNKGSKMTVEMKPGEGCKSGCAVFSGQNLSFDGEEFSGADLTAVFGGVKCDLRNAVIEKDCAIQCCAVFGGIDLLLPDKVNVQVNSNSLFGGIDWKKHCNSAENTITVYVNGTCMFGGIDVK